MRTSSGGTVSWMNSSASPLTITSALLSVLALILKPSVFISTLNEKSPISRRVPFDSGRLNAGPTVAGWAGSIETHPGRRSAGELELFLPAEEHHHVQAVRGVDGDLDLDRAVFLPGFFLEGDRPAEREQPADAVVFRSPAGKWSAWRRSLPELLPDGSA